MAQKATVRKKPPPFQLWCWAFLLGMSMFERGLSGQAGRCQWRPKDVFSHTPLCFGNVDVLFSCLRCILSFHADTHASIKFLTWCWDFHQTRCTQLLICLSLEGNGAPGFFYLPCFWDPLFGNSWRTRLVVEAKIPMPLCAFSWRLSFLMNWSLIEVCVLSGDIAGSPLSDFCFQQQSGLMAQRHIEINPSSCLYRSVWLQHTMLCISMSSHNSHCMLHEVKFATVCRCKCCTSWQAY